MAKVAQWDFDAPVPEAGSKHVVGAQAMLGWDDGGQSLCLEVFPEHAGREQEYDGFFIRLMSWRDGCARGDLTGHPVLARLLGKRVRITVEVVD